MSLAGIAHWHPSHLPSPITTTPPITPDQRPAHCLVRIQWMFEGCDGCDGAASTAGCWISSPPPAGGVPSCSSPPVPNAPLQPETSRTRTQPLSSSSISNPRCLKEGLEQAAPPLGKYLDPRVKAGMHEEQIAGNKHRFRLALSGFSRNPLN